MFGVRKKRTGMITLTVFLLFACAIIVMCLLFLQNYLIVTPDGVRLDFSARLPSRSLNVVVSDKAEVTEGFAPTVVPMVLIEDAELPPQS